MTLGNLVLLHLEAGTEEDTCVVTLSCFDGGGSGLIGRTAIGQVHGGGSLSCAFYEFLVRRSLLSI